MGRPRATGQKRKPIANTIDTTGASISGMDSLRRKLPPRAKVSKSQNSGTNAKHLSLSDEDKKGHCAYAG